jgi:hypothetical protein
MVRRYFLLLFGRRSTLGGQGTPANVLTDITGVAITDITFAFVTGL